MINFAKRSAAVSAVAVVGALAVDHEKTNPIKYAVHSQTLRLEAWVFDGIHGERKRSLFKGLTGKRVLELGPGTGTNFKYLPENMEWTGVDQNPEHTDYLLRNAQHQGHPPATLMLHTASIEGYLRQCKDNSLDNIVGTKVLCAVGDASGVVSEVHRVLKPGGRFYFVETTQSVGFSPSRIIQNAVSPLRYLYDGTWCNRHIARSLFAQGFKQVHMESWPSSVHPEDARHGVTLVTAENGEVASSLSASMTGCVVAGVCVKAEQYTGGKYAKYASF